MPEMIGRGSIFCIVVAALSLSQVARAADEPIRLAPSSPWQLDYADDSCRLARQFGTGERTSVLIMERFKPGDYFQLNVIGKAFGRAESGREAILQFGPTEGEQKATFAEAEWGKASSLIFPKPLRIAPRSDGKEAGAPDEESDETSRPAPAPIGPEREGAVSYLSVDAPGAPEVVFETGSLGEPFVALRKCMDELLTHWGIDAERHKTLTRKARPAESPGTWIRNTDYPTSLLRKGAQGIVHFRLSVNEEGQVSGCHIQRSTRPEGFDQAVCDLMMRRARFEPALDAEGNPIASYYINSVRFVIP